MSWVVDDVAIEGCGESCASFFSQASLAWLLWDLSDLALSISSKAVSGAIILGDAPAEKRHRVMASSARNGTNGSKLS